MVSRAFLFVYLAFLTLVSWQVFSGSASSDLMATWMAGKYFFEGTFDQIYTHYDHLFTMRPPSDWQPYLRANGYNEAIYPFIYPPLWAWAASFLHKFTSFESFALAATLVNPVLLGMTIWLAAKTASQKLPLTLIVIGTTVVFAFSISALVALEQNQPQILVGFLIVLGIERTRSGAPIVGGIAMALAASLKLYPALFALFWLANGERKAPAAFALAGGALGLLSVTTAGWPLHEVFLSDVSAISRTALVTFLSHSIDPTIAMLFFEDQEIVFPSLAVSNPGALREGWAIVEKTALWRALDVALLIGAIAFLIFVARSSKGKDPLFWPMALTLIAVVSPLSWGYHYLPALAFALVLFERARPIFAFVYVIMIFFPSSLIFLYFKPSSIDWSATVQPMATGAMVFYVIILWSHLKKPA
jgi:alpha-1,2-mannosyltransferase